MALAPAEQAVHTAPQRPLGAQLAARRCAAAMLGIIMVAKNGLTRCGPCSKSTRDCASNVVQAAAAAGDHGADVLCLGGHVQTGVADRLARRRDGEVRVGVHAPRDATVEVVPGVEALDLAGDARVDSARRRSG